MERKQFLGATALAGAALAVIGVATATSASDLSTNSTNCGPAPVPKPRPSGSPAANPRPQHSEIESAFKHVDRIITMLQRDPNDYGGHKAPAMAALGQAADQLSQAIAFAQAHPASPPPL
jgi:hypothetical protein